MSNSNLVTVNVPAHSSNYSVGRSGRKIEMIAIHHMAGVLTAKQCGGIFQRVGRKGSSNYGIGKDADVGLYVDEANTSWCNSNWDSNCKSVTIETSNSSIGGDYPVSDKVLNKLIELVADIARRNGLGTLVKGKNVVWHSMYANTNCPGRYLLSKMDYIVEQANKINGQGSSNNENVVANTTNSYLVKVTADALNIRSGAGTNNPIVGCIRDKGTYTIVETYGNWGKLKSGAGWICLDYTSRVSGTAQPSTTNTATSFSKGQRVTLKASANKYCTGQTIPNYVKGKTYTIMQVGSGNTHPNGVLLKEIMSWVYKSDVQ
ncbi:MAG: N-acetylmuramoyl-L-alanine amidase [Clostridia bacterium]|nr:N-acetylmuramoyl-L-alanine amidase [Clostridia bacterium]